MDNIFNYKMENTIQNNKYIKFHPMLDEEINLINSNHSNLYSVGTGKNGCSYLMIKINICKNNLIMINYHLTHLEIFTHKNILKFYGLYYHSESYTYYLSFELPSYSFEEFSKKHLKKFSSKDKYKLLNDIMIIIKFLTENKINYPLFKNSNFFFIKEIKNNDPDQDDSEFKFQFKFLYIGNIISELQSSFTIDIPEIKDIYRSHFLEQTNFFKDYFNIQTNQQNLIIRERKCVNSEILFLCRFYLYIFCKIIISFFSSKECSNENVIDFSPVKNLPNELTLPLKSFIVVYLNTNNQSQRDENVMDNAISDFMNCIKNEINENERTNILDKYKNTSESKLLHNKRKRIDNKRDKNVIDLTLESDNSAKEISKKNPYLKNTNKRPNSSYGENKNSNDIHINLCEIPSSVTTDYTIDEITNKKINYMKRHFPMMIGEPPTYYYKKTEESYDYYLSNAILPCDLPKKEKKNQKLSIKKFNNFLQNSNININMTNFIINNDKKSINCYSQTKLVVDYLKDNLINELSSDQNQNANLSPQQIWCGKILPDTEVENWIRQIKSKWPYDKVGIYCDDMALKLLALCEYNEFLAYNHIIKSSKFFLDFAIENKLIIRKESSPGFNLKSMNEQTEILYDYL